MPTKWPFSKALVSSLGIGLVGLGVIWESLFGPSWPGWVGISVGLILVLVKQKPQHTPLKWPLLILILMSGVSLLATTDYGTSAAQVSRLLAGMAGFFALVNWARQRQHLFLASWVLLVGGMLIGLAAPVVVRWNEAKGIPIPAVIYDAFPLLLADAVHPNVMVSIMILLLPLSLAYLLYARQQGPWPLGSKWGQILLLAALLLMSIVLLLTKSRGGYIAGAIGVLIVLWFSRRRILVTIFALFAAGFGILLAAGGVQQSQTVVGEIADASTMAFRQQVWHIALRMIGDFPFTGVGMGTFNDVAIHLYPFSEVSNPGAHNLALQLSVDLGIPGLIAYLAILLLTLFMGYSSITKVHRLGDIPLWAMAVGLFAGTVALIVHGLVDITVWGTRAAFVPWLIIGLITAVHIYASSKNSEINA